MTQWENLPQPAQRANSIQPSWRGFTADPRVPANQSLRAADADRDFANALLQQAVIDGRLSASEAEERTHLVTQASTLRELAPIVSDLMVAEARFGRTGSNSPLTLGATRAIIAWACLAGLLNAIWLMVGLTTGKLGYYWPMWPMAATVFPVIMAVAWQSPPEAKTRADARQAARQQRRQERHQRRHARRSLPSSAPAALPPSQPARPDDLR